MEQRRLGTSGLRVPILGLGTNNFGSRSDESQSARVLDQSIDIGATFIDTAVIYSNTLSEQFIGRAIKGKRDKVILATKFGSVPIGGGNMADASRKHIMESVEASLKRLQTDYIDLYQLHIPDMVTPLEETLRALDDVIRQGKVRYIGSCNYTGWFATEAEWTARTNRLNRFVSAQNYYNLLKRGVEKELIPACKHFGIGLIPYFPLESGVLTGKYKQGAPIPPGSRMDKAANFRRSLTDANFAKVAALEKFAKERGHTVGELAIAWLASNPAVSTIICGASSPEQVVENAKGLTWRLTPEDLKAIDAIAPVE